MKTFSKILSIVLTASMIFSMACVTGFADAKEYDPYASLKQGTGYVAIGDSFTRGYGAGTKPEDFERWYKEIYTSELKSKPISYVYGDKLNDAKHARNVRDSFPAEIVDLMKLHAPSDITDKTAKYWPLAHDNVSITYMLNLLGVDKKYQKWEQGCHNASMIPRYNADLLLFGDVKDKDNGYESFKFNYDPDYDAEYYAPYQEYTHIGESKVIGVHEMIADARLITIQLGQSEVTYPTMFDAIDVIQDISKGELEMSKLPAEVTKLVKSLYERFKYFKKVLPELIQYIQKLNLGKAMIVIIGTMNPMQNVMLSDDVLLPIGSALNAVTDGMNSFYKKCAQDNGCIYVDINNVDTPSTLTQVSVDSLMDELQSGGKYEDIVRKLYIHGHPTAEGYKQTGRMIVNAIDEELEKRAVAPFKPASTDIKIDVGTNFENVHYVMLDGKTVNLKNFSTKNHLLTIKNDSKNSKNLKVAIARMEDNGFGRKELKITVMTYSLKYSEKTGYSARRTYVTHDAVSTVTTTIKTVNNALDTGLKAVKTGIKNIADTVKGWLSSIKLPSFNY